MRFSANIVVVLALTTGALASFSGSKRATHRGRALLDTGAIVDTVEETVGDIKLPVGRSVLDTVDLGVAGETVEDVVGGIGLVKRATAVETEVVEVLGTLKAGLAEPLADVKAVVGKAVSGIKAEDLKPAFKKLIVELRTANSILGSFTVGETPDVAVATVKPVVVKVFGLIEAVLGQVEKITPDLDLGVVDDLLAEVVKLIAALIGDLGKLVPGLLDVIAQDVLKPVLNVVDGVGCDITVITHTLFALNLGTLVTKLGF